MERKKNVRKKNYLNILNNSFMYDQNHMPNAHVPPGILVLPIPAKLIMWKKKPCVSHNVALYCHELLL